MSWDFYEIRPKSWPQITNQANFQRFGVIFFINPTNPILINPNPNSWNRVHGFDLNCDWQIQPCQPAISIVIFKDFYINPASFELCSNWQIHKFLLLVDELNNVNS
jgi:hypothetical protein